MVFLPRKQDTQKSKSQLPRAPELGVSRRLGAWCSAFNMELTYIKPHFARLKMSMSRSETLPSNRAVHIACYSGWNDVTFRIKVFVHLERLAFDARSHPLWSQTLFC